LSTDFTKGEQHRGWAIDCQRFEEACAPSSEVTIIIIIVTKCLLFFVVSSATVYEV
jgi:hypothetical protein